MRYICKKHWLFFLILVMGFLIRIYGINLPIYETSGTRQEMTASVARNYFVTDTDFLMPLIDFPGKTHPLYLEMPLYPYMVSLLYRVSGGVNESLARLLNILFAMGLMVVVYLFAMSIFTNRKKASWAMAVVAFSPIMITYTRTVQPDPLMFLLSTMTIFFAYRWYRKDLMRDFIIMTVFFSIAMLAKPQSLFAFFPIAYVFWHKYRWKAIYSWQFIVFCCIGGGPFLVWLYFIKKMHILYPNSSWGETASLSQILYQEKLLTLKFWNNFLEYIGGKGLTPIGLFFLIKSVFHRRKMDPFFYVWLGGIFIYLFMFAANTESHKYYYVPLFICAAMFIGHILGEANIGFRRPLHRLWIYFFCFVAFLGILGLKSTYRLADFYQYVIPSSQALRDISHKDDLVIAVRRIYYTERSGWEVPFSHERTDQEIFEEINEKRRKGAKYLLISYRPYIDERPLLKSRLDLSYSLIKDESTFLIYQLEERVKG